MSRVATFMPPCLVLYENTTPSYLLDQPLTPGQIRFYMVRTTSQYQGSWGRGSSGIERTVPCVP